jgi:hypothetical protein
MADRVIPRLPLVTILLVQATLALRLRNSAFQDEALYLYTGHLVLDSWSTGEAVATRPETFFSGAPQLYPVLAALLDTVGGLRLARLFSTLCMLTATVAVHVVAKTLFRGPRERNVAPLAAAVFALAGPVLHLSYFATYDALSFALLAWALAISVWSAVHGKSVGWAVAAGALCAVTVLVKYATAIEVPFVFLTGLVAAGVTGGAWRRGVARALAAGATGAAVLAGSLATWAQPLLAGLQFSTTGRDVFVRAGAWDLVGQALGWAGPAIVLGLAGAAVALRRRPAVTLALTAGSLAAPAYQIVMGESVSFSKHLVLGLVFGAPLAGAALSRLARLPVGPLVLTAAVWATAVHGLGASARLFAVWPDTTDLTQRVAPHPVEAMPWIRILAETPEPTQYALRKDTEPWQWTSTYENAFTYEGLDGVAAYERALSENYFQLVVLAGEDRIGSALLGQLESFGFELTDTVVSRDGYHSWRVYQRFDALE